jgi:Flp pilus assembly protein TadG
MSPRRCHRDHGYVSLFIVMMIPVVLVAAGLVLDGGRQLQARRDANGAAQAAARAAVQMTPPELYAKALNPNLAADRGQAELSRQGHSGAVSVTADRASVTATATVDRLILPGSASVTGKATSNSSTGVNGGSP